MSGLRGQGGLGWSQISSLNYCFSPSLGKTKAKLDFSLAFMKLSLKNINFDEQPYWLFRLLFHRTE